jgi:hypothetical protein
MTRPERGKVIVLLVKTGYRTRNVPGETFERREEIFMDTP